MIVRMKKVSLLCLADDKEATLEALRNLGVMHLEPTTEIRGADVDQARQEEQSAKSALFALNKLGEPDARAKSGTGATAEADTAKSFDAAAAVRRIHELGEAKRTIVDRIAHLTTEKALIEPFGDFDPEAARRLAGHGISVRLFHVPGKKIPPTPEGAVVLALRRDSLGLYAAVAGKGPFGYPGREVPLPARRLSRVESDLENARTERDTIDEELMALRARRRELDFLLRERRERVDYLEAGAGMGASGKIIYLRGYCPGNRIESLRGDAAKHGWGLLIEDPGDTDRVPTLIRNPVWLRPIESLFKVIRILPGYREADVSASFLLFMSLFFAMIVGDAGYGAVLLALTFVARMKAKKAPAEPFRLMMIFGSMTVVWGLLTGVVFGFTNLPAPLRGLRIDWLGNNDNVMFLCLVIGAVHLSVAHLWNLVRFINSTLAIAQLGWVSVTWTMFFAARALLLGKPFPSWYFPIAAGGFAAVVVFMTPWKKMKTEWVNHIMLPLTLMSNFGDILSYLRLFALGVAGLQLAGAFNTMALGMGFSKPLSGLIAAIILFLGHSLNLALGLVSVLVHGIRLNALEFSMHFGLEWAGFTYEPFRTNNKE
jgi:V/A-type H+-transporting ATPase subunit I